MTTFFADKRWQLVSIVGIPALYYAANALITAVAGQGIIIHDAQTTAAVVGLATLFVREVASHKEMLGITTELPAPESAPAGDAALQAVAAFITRHKAEAALIQELQLVLGAVAPAPPIAGPPIAVAVPPPAGTVTIAPPPAT